VTAILLGVLVVLAGVVYYLSQQPTPQEAANKAKTPQILTFNAVDASKVVISGGDKTTEIQRSGSTWELVKPIQTPADANRVEGWVDQLSNLTADQVVENASDLSQYGLAQPKVNVEVSLSAGKTAKLMLGDKTPDGNDYYAQVPDDKKVYLVNSPLGDDLTNALTQPPKALPTPTPLPTLVPATPAPGSETPTSAANLTPTATPAG